MRNLVCCLCTLVCAADCHAADPHWIWGHAITADDEPVRLSYRFGIEQASVSAVLSYASMSAAVQISLDGNEVGRCDPYQGVHRIVLDQRLARGEHELVVGGQGVDGPSAVFLDLSLRLADGTTRRVLSSRQWNRSRIDKVHDFGAIDTRLMIPDDRRVAIHAIDNYEQWKQALGADSGADPASFWVTPGFEIELVRSAAEDEDSWVSLAIDPRGRLIVAKEQTGLLRMTLSGDGDAVTQVESIDETLKECRGLAFIGSDLYVNANNSKGLYRMRDRNGRFEKPELVLASSGGVGHGRNDLAVGPDGMLYSIHGDSVDLPRNATDYTSRYREARRGHPTSEGHCLRIDPKTGDVEILVAGLRNPFGIDFNDVGDVFTYDADAEYDMGAPWYRPTRVNHLVTGADYGWRGVTRSWPPYYPDHPGNAPFNLDIGKGSPTAVKFGSRSHFPQRYRDALFVLDWAYGRIIAVHPMPQGSSYQMTAETFLKGRPLNVTDIDFALDGSMYIVTGGRKTQSALYRVRHVDHHTDHHPGTTHDPTGIQSAANTFAAQSRGRRRKLESYLAIAPDDQQLDDAWPHLSDPDPWLRHAARNVLEHHPPETWQHRALSETEPMAASNALLALARSNRSELFPDILHRLNAMGAAFDSANSRLTALYIYWLLIRSGATLDDDLRARILSILEDQFPSDSFAENRLLSEMLVDLNSEDVVPKTMGLLASSSDQKEQIHYLFVLRGFRGPWTMDQRREYFSALSQASHFLGGAGMPDFLNRIRDETKATLTSIEKEQLGSLVDPRGTAETIPDKFPPREFHKKWTLEDLLSSPPEAVSDPARGAVVFAEAGCIQCHRFGTRGTPIGPDLTSVHRRFSRRDLLDSILDPSKVVAENYRSVKVLTSDGHVYVGQKAPGGDYRSPVLRMAIDPLDPFSITEIPKTQIEAQEFSEVSWMPEGLLDTFKRDEILDLLAYLQSAP